MSNRAAAQTDWKGQYDMLMEQLGMVIESDEKARKLPRFTFKPPERILLVHVGGMVGHIRDISAGGLYTPGPGRVFFDSLKKALS